MTTNQNNFSLSYIIAIAELLRLYKVFYPLSYKSRNLSKFIEHQLRFVDQRIILILYELIACTSLDLYFRFALTQWNLIASFIQVETVLLNITTHLSKLHITSSHLNPCKLCNYIHLYAMSYVKG